ncbi:helix-turn-helix transcriptional regulator [uncultured Tateyamaria sp.]|uniref:helix-turn-helix transcriptional regulator n=1 Tax=uncultured Tateyamaria sp. TaxID=455651 RepID=UPI00262A3E2A|nr:helix-turn-helix transcriptional regulator [uncultured Tateyamaria sp.]
MKPEGYAALAEIYDAAVNLGRWRRALDGVANAVEAKAIALLIRRSDPASKDLQMLNSTYLNFVRSPWGIYYGLRLSRLQDPDWEFLSKQPAHQLTPDTKIGPSAAELDARADYAFLRKRLKLGRRLGVRLNSDKVWFDAMSIAFPTGANQVPVAAIQDTYFLLPHLTKAVELGRTFAELKSRYSAALTALNRVKAGLAIALPSGDIIVENDEAKRILDQQDGLTKERNGRLRCHDHDQNAELSEAIQKAANTARGEDNCDEWLIALQRPSGQSPLLLDVAPLKDSKAELEGPLEGALVTVIDPDRVPHIRVDRFVALYGLTEAEAEAEVCKLVLQGVSIMEMAEMRSTSPVTVKNQISAILSKTGVGRRSELIRMVIRVLPPVE